MPPLAANESQNIGARPGSSSAQVTGPTKCHEPAATAASGAAVADRAGARGVAN